MKKRFFSLILAIILVICSIPVVANASDALQVVASGDDASFIKDAPISTVRIDNTKIKRDNVVLYHPDNSVGFRLDDEGYVYAPKCGVKAWYTGLGYFTLTFADAAILADGTRKNLVIRFNDVTTIGKTDTLNYYDYLKFAHITNNVNAPLTFAPLSVNEGKHVAIRSAVTFSVANAGDDDTFIFAANQINANRQDNNNFKNLVDAYGHYAYSESMEPLGGIADGSELYITENSTLYVVEGTSPGTLGVRFVGSGSNAGDYSEGFATVSKAKEGLTTRIWSSAGTNTAPLSIGLLSPVNAFSLETAAGEHGGISLWADGTANSTTAAKLSGGTTSTPLTYSVPGGKDVTLAITPDFSYEIDTLTVNGQEAQPTRTQYNPNGSVNYELDIPAIAADTTVSVTFKKFHIHQLTYADSTTVFGMDVTCTEENCSWTESKLTVSADVPDVVLLGSGLILPTEPDGKDDLADATRDAVQAKLTYTSKGENPTEYTVFPYILGEYTATITITDAREPNDVKTYSVSKDFVYKEEEDEPVINPGDETDAQDIETPAVGQTAPSSKSKTSPATGNNPGLYFVSFTALMLGLLFAVLYIKRFRGSYNN